MNVKVPVLDLSTVTLASLKAQLADCPECEFCCAIGLCCPPMQQLLTLMAIMVRDTLCSIPEAHKYSLPIVASRIRAMKAA